MKLTIPQPGQTWYNNTNNINCLPGKRLITKIFNNEIYFLDSSNKIEYYTGRLQKTLYSLFINTSWSPNCK